ncbi:MAG: hypothetical protein J6040_05220 [Clostridiales bacterium]|nr:hypothetical protein [Clostridiales bacterium]
MITSSIIESAAFLRNSAITTLQQLDRSYPSISFGTHMVRGRTVKVVRLTTLSDNKRKTIECSLSSPKGMRIQTTSQKILLIRKALETLQLETPSINRAVLKGTPRRIASLGTQEVLPDSQDSAPKALTFSADEWMSLSEWKDTRIVNGYQHGNHVFRSKSELLIAQLLESLGLEYKYEPLIMIGGKERRPDFAVFCPETMRYFFIEHLGLLSDTRYRMDAIAKMEQYDNAGIRDGIDIIYTTEFSQGSFDIDAAYGKIAGAILAQSKTV